MLTECSAFLGFPMPSGRLWTKRCLVRSQRDQREVSRPLEPSSPPSCKKMKGSRACRACRGLLRHAAQQKRGRVCGSRVARVHPFSSGLLAVHCDTFLGSRLSRHSRVPSFRKGCVQQFGRLCWVHRSMTLCKVPRSMMAPPAALRAF